MEKIKAVFKNASPYKDDALNLPVHDVDAAIPYYETILGFHATTRSDDPVKSVVLERDQVRIRLAENGGDPTQEGCFFEVDNVEKALEELVSNGMIKDKSAIGEEKHGNTVWRLFYAIAPDGLCYCFGDRKS